MIEHTEEALEKALLGKYRLAHQHGKDSQGMVPILCSQEMVPILTPVDINNALKLLVRVQPQCAVDSENLYLFATTKSTDGPSCQRMAKCENNMRASWCESAR